MEQVDNHKAMIEELNKSVTSISADIKGLLSNFALATFPWHNKTAK